LNSASIAKRIRECNGKKICDRINELLRILHLNYTYIRSSRFSVALEDIALAYVTMLLIRNESNGRSRFTNIRMYVTKMPKKKLIRITNKQNLISSRIYCLYTYLIFENTCWITIKHTIPSNANSVKGALDANPHRITEFKTVEETMIAFFIMPAS